MLIPIAVIAAVAAAITGGAARGARLREAMVDNRPTPNPAPRNAEPEFGVGQQPATPEQYLDARQKTQ